MGECDNSQQPRRSLGTGSCKYDAPNRMFNYSDPFGHSVSYTFDNANNVFTLTSGSNTTTYKYDSMNRLSTVTTSAGDITYGWKPNGLLANVTYTNERMRTYDYDNANRLKTITNLLATAQTSVTGAVQSQEFDYTYDGTANRLTESRKTDGQPSRSITYGYDELDRLQTASYKDANNTPLANFNYGYDPVGNRNSVTGSDFSGNPVNLTYTFDDVNRLATQTGDPAGKITFTYDSNGNLASKSQAPPPANPGDPAPPPVVTKYSYDVRDQLRTVTAPDGTQTAGFDYDFERRRLAKTAADTSLTYAYDGDQVVDEFSSTGTLVNRYDWGADLARAEIGGEGERFYFSDGVGSITALSGLPTAAAASSAVNEGHTPPPSTMAQTTTFDKAARYEYDPWGEVVSADASDNTFGYTGQKLDSETGLMALGNGERYYSPGLARFTQQDSFNGVLDLPGTLNRHAYVNDNPNRFTDPSGNSFLNSIVDFGKNVSDFVFGGSSTNSYGERRDADLLYKASGLDPNNRASGLGVWVGENFPGVRSAFEALAGWDLDTSQKLSTGQRIWRGATGTFDIVSTVVPALDFLKAGLGAIEALRALEAAATKFEAAARAVAVSARDAVSKALTGKEFEKTLFAKLSRLGATGLFVAN